MDTNELVIDESNQAIFSCLCKEPEGELERFVYPMRLTPNNLEKFWHKASKFKVLFWNNINNNFERFLDVLVSRDSGDKILSNGLFWMMDDMVGIFYLTHMQMFDAQIHYAFFDRRQRGREEITRKMIKYVFNEFGYHRLSAEIPACLVKTTQFVENIGMKFEGRKRDGALMDEKFYDTKCYGILNGEIS
jgi:RimJ/RimL family protein N-acetyltransferase